MAVITSSSAIDWSTVDFDGVDIGIETGIFYGRLVQLVTEFGDGQFFLPPISAPGALPLVVELVSGGQLSINGSGFTGTNPVITVISFSGPDGEAFTVHGTLDLNGLTDRVTQYSYTRDGHTLTGKGSIDVVSASETGEFSGTVTSATLVTSDGYTATLTGSATVSGDQFDSDFAGIFTKLVLTGPGSAAVILQASGLTLSGLGDYTTVADLLAAVSGGNDSVVGGAGNDLLSGFGGNDTISGLAGADTLNGDSGNDSQDGGLGNDSYIGSLGDDTYVIAQALDTIDSAADTGTDTVRLALAGHALHDLSGFANLENVVFAGTGAVTLTGNDSVNSLSGGAGNDTLDGGANADVLRGGAGNDYYYFDDAGDLAVEVAAGGTSDTVELSAGSDVLLVEYFNIENLVLASAAGTVAGTAAANVLTSKNGAHTLNGGLGNDTYNVQAGDSVAEDTSGGGTKDLVNVFLDGGQSFALGDGIENLTVTAGEQNVTGIGNDQANSIAGSGFSDNLSGGAGNDTIAAGAGNDTLDGGSGKNSLAGGLGDDRYITTLFNPTPTTVALDAAIVDTGGIDTQIVTAGEAVFIPAAFKLLLNAAIENLDFSGVDGQNLVATGNALANTITGNWGNNKIDGGAGNDSLDGGDGSDTLLGGAGNDTLEGGGNGAGPEHLDGGLGDDLYYEHGTDATYVIAQAGDSVVDGGEASGVDTVRVALAASAYLDISGSEFLDNVVFTGAGAVTLRGNDGANSLVGGAGADSFFGGLGDDTFGVNSLLDQVNDMGGAADTVLSTVTYSIAAAAGIENLTLAGTAAKATGNGGANLLTGNAAANTLDGGGGNDTLIGGNGADTYLVDSSDDVVEESTGGTAGGIDLVNSSADFELGDNVENANVIGATGRLLTGNGLANKLTGFTGHDTLEGGALNDTLTGGAGNDRLDGGTGNDSLAGGLGDDTYVVDSLTDKITEIANQGTDTVESSITYSIAAALTVENITLTGVTAINATGNAGNNVLTGNVAANTLTGGAGNDTYEFDEADTIVEVGTGGGTDTVRSSTVDITSLAANVENALLTGDEDLDATGNAAANVITGNTGGNALQGLGGNDVLIGGDGNDTAVYTGNQADYVIVELSPGVYQVSSAAEGTDTLTTIENITFDDAADLVLSEMDLTPPVPPAPEPSLKVELDSGTDQRLFGTGTIQISFSFMGTEPSYTDFPGHEGVAAPNNDLKEAIRDALQLWADVTNIQFNETVDAESVQFRFATESIPEDTGLAAYAFLPSSSPANGASLDQGDVWINRDFFLYDDSAAVGFIPGTSMFATLVHEIGHALGLDHPFDDGEEGEVFLADGAFDNNNLYSLMAYDPAPNSSLVEWADTNDFWYGYGGSAEARTPMLYDISTVQEFYGINAETRDGHTTYGTNIADGGFAFSVNQPFFMTIWDGDGIDTIDTSHYSLPSIIDLRPGHFSSIGMSDFLGINDLGDDVDSGVFDDLRADEGYDYLEATPEAPFGVLPNQFAVDLDNADQPWPDTDYFFDGQYDGTNNLAIAEAAVIENAIGGSGADQLIGNNWINRLSGRGGADTLTGGQGGDRFVFDTALNATTNVDRITDFVSGVDKIELDQTIFTALALGAIADADLATLVGTEHIRYAANGDLFYDPNGVGGAVEVKFATLAGHPALAAGDFLVVA